jgi:hypothetical protein
MSNSSKRLLFWAPRIFSILFIVFLSLFALDVFNEGLGFWKTLLALAIHLIPSLVLIAALIVAWRWEWVGAAIYAGAGALYVVTLLPRRLPPPPIKLQWIATIALPAFAIAVLFLANWLKHNQLRTRV